MNYYNCLPEVRAKCEAGKVMSCDGIFPARYGACLTRNRTAVKKQARKEAAYGLAEDRNHGKV